MFLFLLVLYEHWSISLHRIGLTPCLRLCFCTCFISSFCMYLYILSIQYYVEYVLILDMPFIVTYANIRYLHCCENKLQRYAWWVSELHYPFRYKIQCIYMYSVWPNCFISICTLQRHGIWHSDAISVTQEINKWISCCLWNSKWTLRKNVTIENGSRKLRAFITCASYLVHMCFCLITSASNIHIAQLRIYTSKYEMIE